MFAHIGGRYADIKMAHDARIERSVEVHSDWGTFEWLLRDALEQGYRVGILANSDGHKGRHGASHPGASLFGAYGGLSCLLADDLTRAGLVDALRRRHHYATTGCRLVLDVRAAFDAEAQLYADDPQLGPTTSTPVRTAMMGDILRSDDDAVEFRIEALASAPIERLEIRNGLDVLETWRPYDEAALGRRIRVIWEGSEYRGRGRQTIWDGGCTLTDNAFERIAPINLWNLDKKLRQTGPAHAGLGSADHRRLRRVRCLAGRSAVGNASDRYPAGQMRDRGRRYRTGRSGRSRPAASAAASACSACPTRTRTGGCICRAAYRSSDRRQRPLCVPDAGGRSSGLVEPDLRLSLTLETLSNRVRSPLAQPPPARCARHLPRKRGRNLRCSSSAERGRGTMRSMVEGALPRGTFEPE